MNKAAERQYVFQVFGAAAAESATASEQPDFLLTVRSQIVLGVEVTELFFNRGDAKLSHLANYSSSLLDGTQRIHRADIGLFEVDEVTLLDENDEAKARAVAIIQKMPSVKDRIELLLGRIAEKEAKAAKYLQNCQIVDLIIVDRSRLFSDISHEELFRALHLLAPSTSLAQSSFREIYVVTKTKDQRVMYFPLIGNVFIADCFAFSSLLIRDARPGPLTRETYLILRLCLWQAGHHRAQVLHSQHGTRFVCGAWEMYYAEDGLHIRDWRLPFEQCSVERLIDLPLDAPIDLVNKARDVVASRAEHFATVGLRMTANVCAEV